MRHIITMAMAVLAVVCATPVGAQQGLPRASAAGDTLRLTLAEAERLAFAQNGRYRAARARVDVARGELRQASALASNPEAEFEAMGAEGQLGGYRSSLRQELEIGGQRGARRGAAAAELSRMQHLGSDASRILLQAVREAFFRAAAEERRAALMEDMLALQTRLIGAVRTQLAEGEISLLEANLVEVEFGRARAGVLGARRELSEARADLRIRLGIPAGHPFVLVADTAMALPAPPGIDSALAIALAERPDLAATTAVVERAERLASLASRSLVPNPTLGVLAEREDEAGKAQLGVSVALPLPFWNRNRGEVAARRADIVSAQYEREAARNEVGNEVAAAVEAYALAVEQLRLLEAAVVAPARENQRLLEISYGEGKTGLPSILLLRNQLLEAELEYLDAWLAARTILAELEAAIGAPLSTGIDSDDR